MYLLPKDEIKRWEEFILLTEDETVLDNIYEYFTKLSEHEDKGLVMRLVEKGAAKELVQKLQTLKKKHTQKIKNKNKKYGAEKGGTTS